MAMVVDGESIGMVLVALNGPHARPLTTTDATTWVAPPFGVKLTNAFVSDEVAVAPVSVQRYVAPFVKFTFAPAAFVEQRRSGE
jgi:hypothetical protein